MAHLLIMPHLQRGDGISPTLSFKDVKSVWLYYCSCSDGAIIWLQNRAHPINSLLGSNSFGASGLLLGTFSEEGCSVGGLGLGVSGEGLVGNLGHINTFKVDFRAGGQGINLVDAFDWHAVHLVGACNKEEA